MPADADQNGDVVDQGRGVGFQTFLGFSPLSIVEGRWPPEPRACAAAIGSALAARLHPFGIRTTADLVAMAPASAGDVGTVVLERLVRELNAVECDGFKSEPEASEATAVTRQFGVPVTDLDELCEAMVRRARARPRRFVTKSW